MYALFTTITTGSVVWSLVAFAIAGAVYWLAQRKGPVLASAWVTIAFFAAAGLLPVIGYLRSFAPYHVHVLVVGPPGASVEHARVWSSLQDKPTKVADGWQLEIPASSLPEDRVLLVWAALDPTDAQHSQAITLGADHHPSVTVRISADRSATIAGWVVNRDGKRIDGALVGLADQGGPDSILTLLGGSFVLPARAAPGEQVMLQVSAGGFQVKYAWVTAGDQNIQIMLDRPSARSAAQP